MKRINFDVLIKRTNVGYSTCFFKMVLGVVLYLGITAMLALFPLFGISLVVFFMGYLCLCFRGYSIGVLTNKNLKIEQFFADIKLSLKAFCVKVATMLKIILWGLVFVIPGIITWLNYAFCFFILAENNQLDAFEVMEQSKKLTYGHRGEIFVVMLAGLFLGMACFCIGALVAIAIGYFVAIPLWISLTILFGIGGALTLCFVLPYYEFTITNLYLFAKSAQLTPIIKKQNKSK